MSMEWQTIEGRQRSCSCLPRAETLLTTTLILIPTPHTPPLTNYLGISNDNFRELSTWRAIYYLSYERYHFTSSSFPPRNTTFDISICWDKYKCLNTLLIWITRKSLSSLSSAINICQNYLNKCKLCMINWYILKFQHNLFNRREYFYKLNTITRLIEHWNYSAY